MELVNSANRYDVNDANDEALLQEALEVVVLLLAPIVPHVCHRLWQDLGHADAVIDADWPIADDSARAADSVTVVVQVNGKLRAKLDLPAGAAKDVAEEAALANDNVQKFIDGKPIRKVIVVPDKLVNVVV